MKPISLVTTHERCKEKTNLDGLLVLTTFSGPVKELIVNIKYHYHFDMNYTLALFVAEYAYRSPAFHSLHPRAFLPIPSHPDRQRERGFNQSDILAREVSKILHIPYTNKVLEKTRNTTPQAQLKKDARLHNLEDVFKCSLRLKKSDIYILVDDVVTTGATLSAAAKTLKKAGAGKVYGLASAHGH